MVIGDLPLLKLFFLILKLELTISVTTSYSWKDLFSLNDYCKHNHVQCRIRNEQNIVKQRSEAALIVKHSATSVNTSWMIIEPGVCRPDKCLIRGLPAGQACYRGH